MSVTTTIPFVINGDPGDELAVRQAQNYCVAHELILVAYNIKRESPNQTIVEMTVAKG